MRTMSAGFDDQSRISDNLTLQYGFTMDLVSFLDHLNYYSPYARLTYAVDQNDDLIVAYTSGNGASRSWWKPRCRSFGPARRR